MAYVAIKRVTFATREITRDDKDRRAYAKVRLLMKRRADR